MVDELSWETQSDWDAAQSRNGVVTRAIGDRDADEIWQGYDPTDPALSDAVAYWTMDESGSTVSDVIGSHDGSVVGAQAEQTGLLSSTAFSFDAIDDRVEVDSMPLADPGASWTVNLWVNLDGGSTHQLFFSLEDSVADESLGVGVWDDDNAKIYSRGRTPGTGSAFPIGSWTMVTLRWDGSTETAEMFVNGSFDYSVEPDGGAVFANANQITIGDRRLGLQDPLAGRLDEPILFDRALSDSEIQDLYDVTAGGSLETATQQSSGEATEVTASASIPTNTSIDLTVYQDVDGATNSETVALDDGTNTYPLSEFELGGTDYWAELSFSTTSAQDSAQFQAATVTVEAEPVTLASTATDPDRATADTARTRPLAVATAAGPDTATATAARSRALGTTPADPDTAVAPLARGRSVTSTIATDPDSATATATRARAFGGGAVDPDTAVTTATRTRALFASATDPDASAWPLVAVPGHIVLLRTSTADQDAALTTTARTRAITSIATAADPDTTHAPLTRARRLASAAANGADSATATAARARGLVGSAFDPDAAVGDVTGPAIVFAGQATERIAASVAFETDWIAATVAGETDRIVSEGDDETDRITVRR